jgi:hypothetical protein
MRNKVLVLALVLAACGDDGSGVRSDAPPFIVPDAPEFAPIITSLSASPTQLTSGVATQVTFTWTYLVTPTFPEPACTIDNGVGPVTSGMPVSVTITQMTLFTLSCTNSAGTAMRQVILTVPPVAPQLATFAVNTASVAPNTPTNVKFTWTYSNTPSPAPTCSIDNGQTTITSGTDVSITLSQARTFRLRCSNGVGSPVFSGGSVLDVTVAVAECSSASSYSCDPHATCTDTLESYTCSCASGYTASGDLCLYNTATATDCDQTNCPLNGATCVPKAGFFGSGQTGDCKRGRFTFLTPLTYNGLPGTYVAWLSDATNDAYCRVQSDGTATGHLNGKKGNNCGQGALPIAAGPWVRVGDYKQVFPRIDQLLAPNNVTYYAANTNDAGAEITTFDRVWTGTDNTGQYVANGTCGAAGTEWQSSSASLYGAAGEVHGGGSSWTRTTNSTTDLACSSVAHLRCMEVTNVASPTLPTRHRADNVAFTSGFKKAFLTSVTGNGNLTAWPDNYGASTTGYLAGDAICQARARYAGYANPSTFKAWISTYPYIGSPYGVTPHVVSSASGYMRPDNVVLGTTRADMLDGKLAAAWEETETNGYPTGSADTGNVVTNVYANSGSYFQFSTTYNCNYWTTSTTGYYNFFGRYDLLDGRSMDVGAFFNSTSSLYYTACDQQTRLFCVEDSSLRA